MTDREAWLLDQATSLHSELDLALGEARVCVYGDFADLPQRAAEVAELATKLARVAIRLSERRMT